MVCSLAAGWGWDQLVTFTETTPSSPIGVKVAQSCWTLCDPMDYTDQGVLQSRTLEHVAVPFSRGSSQPRDQTPISHVAGRFFTS